MNLAFKEFKDVVSSLILNRNHSPLNTVTSNGHLQTLLKKYIVQNLSLHLPSFLSNLYRSNHKDQVISAQFGATSVVSYLFPSLLTKGYADLVKVRYRVDLINDLDN